MRKTKIVATVGPATDSEEMIEKLILAGVNVFRFTFSHSTHEYHGANLLKVRKVADKLGACVAVLQDISGPKIRVGEVDGVMALEPDDTLSFYEKPGFDDKYGVTINHPHILPSLKSGDLIYLADGCIRCEVFDNSNGVVKTKIVIGGDLTRKKGVNFPKANLPISAITEKDIRDMGYLMEDSVVRDTIFKKVPFVLYYPESKASMCIKRLTAKFTGDEIEKRAGIIDKLRGWFR